jgi:RNA polymerase sigma-70 factor (ECF subfamily)
LPRFEHRSSARTWLLAIARHVCADSIRAARRRRTFEAAEAGQVRRRFIAGADHAEIVHLALLLDALAPERREALVLTQIVGLSYDEAAEVCCVPVGTIRSRVARARADLQSQLGETAV